MAKHYSLDEHTRVPDVIVFSQKIWNGFSPQVRAWIEQAAAESVPFQRKLWREQTDDALRQVQKAGVVVYRPDQSAFAAANGPDVHAGRRHAPGRAGAPDSRRRVTRLRV